MNPRRRPLSIATACLPRSVDLSFVINLDFDLDLAADGSETSELSLLRVVLGGVELGVVVGQLYGGDDEVILLGARRQYANDILATFTDSN